RVPQIMNPWSPDSRWCDLREHQHPPKSLVGNARLDATVAGGKEQVAVCDGPTKSESDVLPERSLRRGMKRHEATLPEFRAANREYAIRRKVLDTKVECLRATQPCCSDESDQGPVSFAPQGICIRHAQPICGGQKPGDFVVRIDVWEWSRRAHCERVSG